MNEIIESLQNLGLNHKESKIYLSLLKLGQADVGDIAVESEIKRPTVYVVLDELRKKGLVLKIPNAKKTIFQAKTPDEFYAKVKNDINQFERVLPKLRSLNPKKEPIKTLYFEGADGIKEAMYYRIKDLKDSVTDGFWAKDSGISKNVIKIFDGWNEDRKKYNLLTSGVTPDDDSTRKYVERYKEFYKDFIFAPLKDYSSDISIEVTEKFIRIIDGHELKAIIIENPRVLDAMKQIFELAKRNYKKLDIEKETFL